MFQKINIKVSFFLALLFLFYFNHITKVYLHGDVIIYLTDIKDGYHNHSQFHWLVSLGRFITAYFDYYVLFKNINIIVEFTEYSSNSIYLSSSSSLLVLLLFRNELRMEGLDQ